MRVLKQSIADRIREGRLPDGLMPVRRGHLAGDDRRARAIPILQELQEVAAFGLLEGCHAEVVQDEDVHADALREEAAVKGKPGGDWPRMGAGRAPTPTAAPVPAADRAGTDDLITRQWIG